LLHVCELHLCNLVQTPLPLTTVHIQNISTSIKWPTAQPKTAVMIVYESTVYMALHPIWQSLC